MKNKLKKLIPSGAWAALKTGYYFILKYKYLFIGRPRTKAETSKASPRRMREGFFEKYCKGKGLDIGYGGDLLVPNCTGWDFEHGDAQYLTGLQDESFDFVYSSHTIEHMVDPAVALKNWWRVVKKGGYLIVYAPHRDLYEKKKELPSRWNADHKHFFLLDHDEQPDTLGLTLLIAKNLMGYEFIYAMECREGHTVIAPERHSDGEYSIEVVLKKTI